MSAISGVQCGFTPFSLPSLPFSRSNETTFIYSSLLIPFCALRTSASLKYFSNVFIPSPKINSPTKPEPKRAVYLPAKPLSASSPLSWNSFSVLSPPYGPIRPVKPQIEAIFHIDIIPLKYLFKLKPVVISTTFGKAMSRASWRTVSG